MAGVDTKDKCDGLGQPKIRSCAQCLTTNDATHPLNVIQQKEQEKTNHDLND